MPLISLLINEKSQLYMHIKNSIHGKGRKKWLGAHCMLFTWKWSEGSCTMMLYSERDLERRGGKKGLRIRANEMGEN